MFMYIDCVLSFFVSLVSFDQVYKASKSIPSHEMVKKNQFVVPLERLVNSMFLVLFPPLEKSVNSTFFGSRPST